MVSRATLFPMTRARRHPNARRTARFRRRGASSRRLRRRISSATSPSADHRRARPARGPSVRRVLADDRHAEGRVLARASGARPRIRTQNRLADRTAVPHVPVLDGLPVVRALWWWLPSRPLPAGAGLLVHSLHSRTWTWKVRMNDFSFPDPTPRCAGRDQRGAVRVAASLAPRSPWMGERRCR